MFIKGEGDSVVEFRSEPDPKQHVLAHVFKVVMDPFVGKLGVFRVHQGTVTRDTQLFVGDSRKPFKVGHLFMLQGGKNVEIDSAVPGDIAAVAKVDEIEFDCVLHDSHDEDHIHMRPLEFPTPMQGVALAPKKRGDEQRIWEVLHRMTAEDPTLVVEHDPNSNETVLRALGELHLRSVLERMSTQFKLEIETRPPRIPYRETITAPAEGFHRHKKQTGGAGQFGEVSLRIEPQRARRGLRVRRLDQGRRHSASVHAGGAQGRRAGARHRRHRGFPDARRARRHLRRQAPSRRLEGSRVRLGGHARHSSTRSKRRSPSCWSRSSAWRVICPDAKTGDIAGDLSSRRGQVTGTRACRPECSRSPASRRWSSSTATRRGSKSVTGGQGSWTMQLSHYEPAPANLQQQLSAEYRKSRKHEEE